MSARARPGARIGAGAIRVDPKRAIEKLREFQLADPAGWVFEVIRAAVGFGAVSIELRGDSDEVWLVWRGPVPTAEQLVGLFGQLVSPQHGQEGRARRLLAIGVNAALGTRPRRVDVYRAAEGRTERFRYRPSLLEGSGGDRSLEPEREEVPEAPVLPAEGLAVHLVRPFGLPVAETFFLQGGRPAEVRAAPAVCADLPVPLAIEGETLEARPALLRLPLEAGLEGYVALVDPAHVEPRAGAVLEAAELGVVMTTVPWRPAPLAGATGPLPLHAFVSAERLPANASRSDVRREEAPIPEALARADELLPPLLDALARELPEATGERRARLRAAALALLASVAGGVEVMSKLRHGALPPALVPLLDLPLLMDAYGRSRSAKELGASRGALVHDGPEPLGLDLEAWLGDVPWMPPGDDARLLLAGNPPPSIASTLAQAEAALAKRKAFLAHPPVAPTLAPSSEQWLAVRVEAPPIGLAAELEDVSSDARGELALLGPFARRPGIHVQVLLHGRPIERIVLPAPLPMEAVIESASLVPRPDYQGVVADATLRAALRRVVCAALSALEALANPRPSECEQRPGFPPLDVAAGLERCEAYAREAAGAALTLFSGNVTRGNPDKRARAVLLGTTSRLAGAAVWPEVVGDALELVTLRSLAEAAEDPIVVVPIEAPLRSLPSGGFRCLGLEPPEALSLSRALEGRRVVQLYDPARGVGEGAGIERMLARLGGLGRAALVVQAEDHRAVVAWGDDRTTRLLYHRGVPLVSRDHVGAFAPCSIALDHDGVIPTTAWDGVVAGPRPEPDVRALEEALVVAYAEHLLGRPRPDLRVLRGTADDGPRRGLLLALANGAALPGDVLAGVRALPLVDRLAPHPPVSLDDLSAAPGKLLVYVLPTEARIDFDPGDFAPIVADRVLAAALGRLLQRGPKAVGRQLPELAREKKRLAAKAALLAAPAAPVALTGVALETAVDTEAGPGRIGLRNAPGGLELEIRVEGRALLSHRDDGGPPVRGYLAVTDAELGPSFDALTPASLSRVHAVVEASVRALLEAMVARAPDLAATSATARALVERLLRGRDVLDESDALVVALRERLLFPGLRGERVSVEAARQAKCILVCRFGAEWLGPAEGERPTRLDGPVLLLPEGAAGDALLGLVELLAGSRTIDDVTGEARDLQSRRRVEQGRVPPPKVTAEDPRLVGSIASLAGKSRALAELGVGEIALAPGEKSEVRVFELGVLVARVPLELTPAVSVAVESPMLASALDATGKLPKDAHRRLQKRVAGLRASLGRAILRDPPDALEPWSRAALRALALSDETFDPKTYRDAPLFETTDGRLLSLGALEEEPPHRLPIWAIPEWVGSERPSDPARPVLRLSLSEVERLAARVPVIDGRDALARDVAEQAFLARPRVDLHAPPRDAEALGEVRWDEGDGSRAGLCVSLAPASAAARGLEIVHEGRLLVRLDDPAEWPCFARVSDPALVPTASFDGVEPGPALDKLAKAVRDAAESAVLASLSPPDEALSVLIVDRTIAGRPSSGAAVRGVVHLDAGFHGGGLELVHPGGRSYPSIEAPELHRTTMRYLPIRGRLLSTAAGTADERRWVELVARDAYAELVRRMAEDLEPGIDAEAKVAHVLRAALVGLVKTQDPRVGDILLRCFVPEPQRLADIVRSARNEERIAVATRKELANVAPRGRTLIDDGSPVSATLLEQFEGRVDRPYARWRSLLGLGVDVAAEAEAAVAPSPASPSAELASATKARGSTANANAKAKAKKRKRPHAPKAKPSHPLTPVAAALHALLRRAGLGGQHLVSVAIQDARRRPLLEYDADQRRLLLAGASPVLAALLPLVERGDALAEEALVVLAARAAGVLNRALSPVTDATEAAALASLLEELAEPSRS